MSEIDFSNGGAPGVAREGGPAGRRGPGVYAHVPFCATRCDFCAFYEETPTAQSVRRYLDGVEREVEMVAGEIKNPATVFWGGGTPGLLAARDLRRLGEITGRLWRGGRAPVEWTVELAPGSVSEARLEALREIGVTRVSMGAQSFQPALLEALGRRHSPAQIYRACKRIRAAGFENLNIDLMFALPGQEDGDWLSDLREAVALGPEHLSTYCLTFEEDTALWARLARGGARRDAGREARLYELAWAWLGEAGFGQYEISNFARAGRECIHNLNTWRMGEWAGLGPSAASQHAGWRGANAGDLGEWLAGLARGERAMRERMALTPALLAEDALIFGLRMNEGVDVAGLRAGAGDAAGAGGLDWARVDEFVERLAGEGLAAREGGRVRLTLRGRLLADAIGGELLGIFTDAPG